MTKLDLTTEKYMHDVCPFKIGQRVRVAPTYRYAAFFPDEYVVIGIRWEIELGDGSVSIKLAKDIHIAQGCGQVGKFHCDDLMPACQKLEPLNAPLPANHP